MTDESTPSPSFGQRLGRAFGIFFRALVRLLAIVAFILLVGIAAFYAIPALYRRYIQPIQNSVNQLNQTQAKQTQINEQILGRLDDIEKRINALETRNDTQAQAMDELRAELDGIPGTQQAYVEQLDSTQTAALAMLDQLSADLDTLDKKVARLTIALEQTNSQVQALDGQLRAEDAPISVLRREVQIVKAMELLTRSRLLIIDNNLGLAADELHSARDLVASMKVADSQEKAQMDIVKRLDLALGNLPDSPVLAAEDVEIAWQLILKGLPGEPLIPTSSYVAPTPTVTPTASATQETPQPSTTPGETPTPTPTP
jgi:tetrahydromethanopterin S-methyltransferase subunit G